VTGAISLHLTADVKSRCGPGGAHCLTSDQGRAALAGRLADTSTTMFVLGGVAAAGGIVLVVVHARSQVEVGLGPRSWSVRGVF
jgi:hypothetical protein